MIVAIGINDIFADRTGNASADDWEDLVDSIKNRTGVQRVHPWNMTPIGDSNPSYTASRRTELKVLRDRINAYCASNSDVTLFDSYGSAEDPGNADNWRSGDTSDQVHPIQPGLERLASDFAAQTWGLL